MLTLAIYFIGICSSLKGILILFTIITGMAIFASLMALGMTDNYDMNHGTPVFKSFISSGPKIVKRLIIMFCVFAFLSAATPNGKTIAAMILIPAIVQNEQIQNIAGNSLSILEKMTKNYLDDLIKDEYTENHKNSGKI